MSVYLYFHVSETPLDVNARGEVVLYPRVPERLAPEENRTVPRVCVAERIAHCLRMVSWTDFCEDFWVYGLRTPVDRVGVDTVNPRLLVPDFGRTARHREVWLTRKAVFQCLGRVRMDRVALVLGRPCYWWLEAIHADLPQDPDCMTAVQVDGYLKSQDFYDRMRSELEAEVRAKGGMLLGDALAAHYGVK